MSSATLAAQLVSALVDQLPPNVELTAYVVAVGVLVDVDVETLEAELRRLTPGAEVRIERVEALLECADCGAHYPAEESPCPVCGSGRGALVTGSEFAVTHATARPRG